MQAVVQTHRSPNKAPIAKLDVSDVADVNAAIAPKMSGAPLPRATNVMPARFSSRFKLKAIQFSEGTK